eukprot:TRINITY_DN4145_c0_g1_i1.p1 TRINITY_DN4145_c0_g1~~TRINITY_DN4145_c0_g1_i1.p1  ORF type:complete len:1567 (+),score=366.41 TRINITY_DN4145_c0_g1_i1:74-4702(+)
MAQPAPGSAATTAGDFEPEPFLDVKVSCPKDTAYEKFTGRYKLADRLWNDAPMWVNQDTPSSVVKALRYRGSYYGGWEFVRKTTMWISSSCSPSSIAPQSINTWRCSHAVAVTITCPPRGVDVITAAAAVAVAAAAAEGVPWKVVESLRSSAGLPGLPPPEATVDPHPPLDGAVCATADARNWVCSARERWEGTFVKATAPLLRSETGAREGFQLEQEKEWIDIRLADREQRNEVQKQETVLRSAEHFEACQGGAVVVGACNEFCGIRLAACGDLEERWRGKVMDAERGGRLPLEHGATLSLLWHQVAAGAAYLVEQYDELLRRMPDVFRLAAVARVTHLRLVADGTPGAICGVYQRTFQERPTWKHADPECDTALQLSPDAYTACGADVLPLIDANWGCVAGLVVNEHSGSDGWRVVPDARLEVAKPLGGCSQLPEERTETLLELTGIPQWLRAITADSNLAQARRLAWQRRAALCKATEAATANEDSASSGALRRRRDAARQEALDAQQHLVIALGAPELEELRAGAVGRRLRELEARLAAAGVFAAPVEHEPEGEESAGGRTACATFIEQAGSASSSALKAFEQWQADYEAAVVAAEQRTDAALAAARRFNEEGTPSLRVLLDEVDAAAAAEAKLRASADGVTTPPLDHADSAAAAALRALEAGLGVVAALPAELKEAEAVRDELAEGCQEAEGGRFYERVARLTAPEPECSDAPNRASDSAVCDARRQLKDAMKLKDDLDPAGWENLCKVLRQKLAAAEAQAALPAAGERTLKELQRQAEHMRVEIELADPSEREDLQQQRGRILQQLHELRKARAQEASQLLRLAIVHFPEAVRSLCQGLHQWLSGLLLSKRPAALRLLLAGGSLSDYTKIGSDLATSRRHTVYRAESGSGRVVIKKVPLCPPGNQSCVDDDASAEQLRAFGRGVLMMDAAGDVAAAVRCVFIDGEYGCVVMEDYPFDLLSWAATERAAEVTPAAVLRMVQLLLGCLVRLHSPTAEFPEGIVHGDVTPANVVVDVSCRPRFIDFEMACAARGRAESGLSTMPVQGHTVGFAAPELLMGSHGPRDPQQPATRQSDVYGMGATIRWLLKLPHIAKSAVAGAADVLLPLCDAMTHDDPEKRPSPTEALSRSDITEALDKHLRKRQEELEVQLGKISAECHRAETRHAEALAERDRVAAEEAALRRREGDLQSKSEAAREEHRRQQEELEKRSRALAQQSEVLSGERKELDDQRSEVQGKLDKLDKDKDEFYHPPRHWLDTALPPQGWRAIAVPSSSPAFGCLARCLTPDAVHFRPSGRDYKEPGSHTKLVLQRAWCIEHPARWRQYALARHSIRDALNNEQLPVTSLSVRQQVGDSLGPKSTELPEPLWDAGGVNELRLLHGTAPDRILGIITDGLNERLSGSSAGAAFGQGAYFAEDAGKCDQYAVGHCPNAHPDLERRLYNDPATAYPGGKVYYAFVCRVVCGCAAETTDGKYLRGGGPLWATSDRRELEYTPGTGADRKRYTSLLVDVGGRLVRYREFVVFDGQRVYPEYLLAYRRE